MNTQERYEALIRIQGQLNEWSAYQPEHHHKLYGGKEINECVQLCKKLISELAMELLVEESERLDLYSCKSDDSINDSLGLSNIN